MASIANAVVDEGLTSAELGLSTFTTWPSFVDTFPDAVVNERFLY